MGEFKDAPVWRKWFFLCITLALTHLFFGFAARLGEGARASYEGFFVLGYLGLVVALVLALAIVVTDDLGSNRIALICFIVFAFVGGKSTFF